MIPIIDINKGDAVRCRRFVSQQRHPMSCGAGELDWQVPVSDGTALWVDRCPDMEIVVLPHITHLLTMTESSSGTVEDYVAGSSVDASVIDTIAA